MRTADLELGVFYAYGSLGAFILDPIRQYSRYTYAPRYTPNASGKGALILGIVAHPASSVESRPLAAMYTAKDYRAGIPVPLGYVPQLLSPRQITGTWERAETKARREEIGAQADAERTAVRKAMAELVKGLEDHGVGAPVSIDYDYVRLTHEQLRTLLEVD